MNNIIEDMAPKEKYNNAKDNNVEVLAL